MKQESSWKNYTEAELAQVDRLAAGYIDFISNCKTERECTDFARRAAEERGYTMLAAAIAENKPLKPGDKLWASIHGKSIILIHLGKRPLTEGLNILGAHLDSPRLDLKQNPLYEAGGLAFADTHYYGGIKKYQWVTLPLALHGVVVKKDGSTVSVEIGEDPSDPVFCVTDLLPHLARNQMTKKAAEVVEGEALDVLIGSRPLRFDSEKDEGNEDGGSEEKDGDEGDEGNLKKEPVKALMLRHLKERYNIEEEDLLSAELEVVPAGRARECGLDRSMVIGYGQDDRVCSYAALMAQFELGDGEAAQREEDATSRTRGSGGGENAEAGGTPLVSGIPEVTGVCILVDKEEIGSVGATGMASRFFENTMAEIMALAGEAGDLKLRRALAASHMLSCDVSAAFDPAYPQVFEAKNSSYLGHGLVFNKYTGSRGKAGSNDASAEFLARIRRVMDGAAVKYQSAELGKVDEGGGGTIAYIPAKYGMNVIDSGVAVLSMHSPWEVVSKADLYEAHKGYRAFLQHT